jgi:uncharacterized protein
MPRSLHTLLEIALLFLVWMGLWMPFAVLIAFKLQWHPLKPVTPQQKIPLLLSLYLVAPVVIWGVAKYNRTSLSAYGLVFNQDFFLRSPLLGIGIGISSIGLLIIGQQQQGWLSYSWHKIDSTTNPYVVTLMTLLIAILVGAVEESVFRGVVLNQLAQLCSPWRAAAIASMLFAVSHLLWDGKAGLLQLPGLWLMGMTLCLSRWVDGGSLGLAWGLHTGWVWAITSLDSLNVLTYNPQTPQWLVGYDGKPLAGLSGLLSLLLVGIGLWAYGSLPGL